MEEIASFTKRMNIGLMAPAVPPTLENAQTLIERGVKMLIMGSDM